MLILQTIIVYIGLVVLMMFYSKKSIPNRRKYFIWIPILVYTLVFGVRYGVGIDYYSYVRFYNAAASGINSYVVDFTEPGFQFFVKSCAALDTGVVLYMCALVFLQIVFLFGAFKRERYILPFLSFFIIFTGASMMTYMNIMRQFVAWGIFVYSIQYIERGKFLKYVLLVLFASSFHFSALIFLPLYCIRYCYKILDNALVQLVLLFLCVLSLYINPIGELMEKSEILVAAMGYEDYYLKDAINDENKRTFGLFDFFQLLVYCIVIVQSKKMKSFYNSKKLEIMYFFFVIGVFLSYICRGSMMFTRVVQYFLNFDSIVFAYYCYFWKSHWRTIPSYRKIATTFCLLICLGFARILYYSADNTVQYAFYFQKDYIKVKDKQFLRSHIIKE